MMILQRVLRSLAPALLLAACSGGPPPSPERALREAFPEQAALVLERGAGFSPGPHGFVRGARPGAWGRVTAELPADGAGEVVLHAGGGLEVRVRELGGGGDAEQAGRAIAYRRPGGTSFWTAAGPDVEEWLHAEPGAAAAGGALAAWEVEGAAVQQRDDAVEIVDGAGAARIRVTAPLAFAAGGRPIQARLEAHGARIELHVEPTAGAVLVDPAWSVVAPMPAPRYGPTAALLPNGEVLVAGGEAVNFSGELTTTVLYDPATDTWSAGAPTTEPQYGGFMTLLGSGKVLLAGGLLGNPSSATCELYDPATGAWSPAAPMITAQYGGGTVLANGEVMVSGGPTVAGDGSLATVEIYDPVADTWAPAASMSTVRDGHTATLLADGRVLAAGGYDDVTVISSAEIYDPTTDSWKPAAPMAGARMFHTGTLLGDGSVLVTGGTAVFPGTTALASSEIYHPATDTWTAAGPLAAAQYGQVATLLGDGTVLVTIGFDGVNDLAGAERFDPASGTWLDAGSMTSPQSLAAVVQLGGSSVLVVGGYDGAQVAATAELFTLLPQGAACTGAGECASRFCADGFCCDAACGAGSCHACSKAAGAVADGTCSPISGAACDDGDACTLVDACVGGVCQGGSPVACGSLDPCHPGACDPQSGVCSFPAGPDGAPCDDHNLCTGASACHGGVCLGTAPVVCSASDDCHDAVCDPTTGACQAVPKPDGASCDDHDACTQDDTCVLGACTGGTPVVCAPQDACHGGGVCVPATGCTNPVLPSCSAPPSMSGSGPDGELCGGDAACAHGHCVRGVCCDSACTETCSSCALPGSLGKCTVEPEGIDLDQDCGPAANCLSTCGPGGACEGARQGTQCLPSRCVDDHRGLGPAECPFQGAACPEDQSVPFDCAPYVCEAPFGACATSCRTVADCAPGYVCDAAYHCGHPPDVAGGSDAGCQHAPGPVTGGGAVGWLLALALGRRLRRGARARRSPVV